jgi:hypothetical protein
MSHISANTAALESGGIGLTDPLLYDVRITQQSMNVVVGNGVILCRGLRAITISLPRANTVKGRAFIVMKIDTTANPVTITGQDIHDQVNGQRQVQLTTPFETKTVVSDGQSWWVLDRDPAALHRGDPGTLPAGGAADQVLVKNSATDYDVGWETPHWVPLPATRVARPRAAGGSAITTIMTVDRVVLPGDPLSDQEAATKHYVDASIPTTLPPSGPAGGDLQGSSYPAPIIAPAAVTDAKVHDVAWPKITGAPTTYPPSGPAGGDLQGSSYPAPVIAPGAVTLAKLAPGAATGASQSETIPLSTAIPATETTLYTKAITTAHGGGLLVILAPTVSFPAGPQATYTITLRVKLDGTTLATLGPGSVSRVQGAGAWWTPSLFAFVPLLTPSAHTVTLTGLDTGGFLGAVICAMSCVLLAFA